MLQFLVSHQPQVVRLACFVQSFSAKVRDFENMPRYFSIVVSHLTIIADAQVRDEDHYATDFHFEHAASRTREEIEEAHKLFSLFNTGSRM